METCEHAEKMIEAYKGAPNDCGVEAPHAPHDNCRGIFCDYGCNAEYF
jgi:hypothetical protein